MNTTLKEFHIPSADAADISKYDVLFLVLCVLHVMNIYYNMIAREKEARTAEHIREMERDLAVMENIRARRQKQKKN